MKFKRFVSLLCVLFIAFSVCSAATVFAEASAVAFKGTRVLELESDPSDMDNYINGGRAAFDLMLRKNAPEWLKFSVSTRDRKVLTSISFEFGSYEELTERLGVLLTVSPSVVYSNDGEFMYAEGFLSAELLNFALLPLSYGSKDGTEVFRTAENKLILGDNEYTSGGDMMSAFEGDRILADAFDMHTEVVNDVYTRWLILWLNNDSADKKDAAVIEKRFKSVEKPVVEDEGNAKKLKVEFKANTEAELTTKTMMCLHASAAVLKSYEYVDSDNVKVTRTEYIDTASVLRENKKFVYKYIMSESYREFSVPDDSKAVVAGNSVSAENLSKIVISYECDPGFASVDVINDLSSLFGRMTQKIVYKMPMSVAGYFHDEIKEELSGKLIKGSTLNIYETGGNRCYELVFSSMSADEINKLADAIGISFEFERKTSFIPFLKSTVSQSVKSKSPVKRFAAPYESNIIILLSGTSFSPDSNAKKGIYVNGKTVTAPIGTKGNVQFSYRELYLPKALLLLILIVVVVIAVLIMIKKLRARFKSAGAKQKRIKNHTQSTVCPNCSKECSPNDLFCMNCGFKLK